MINKKQFSNRGRSWSCWLDDYSGFWMGSSSDPEILLAAESWDDLRQEMSTVDITKPRQDGVAVADSLSIGAEQGV